jgi:hypothetical protein
MISPLPSVGTQINDVLGKFGLPGGFLGAQVDTLLGNPLGALANLRDGFQEAAKGRGTSKFERITGRLPHAHPQCPNKLLNAYRPLCGAGYHGGRQRIDLAAGTPNNRLSRIFNPRRRGAAQLERLLKTNPRARAAFERAVGGRITSFGKSDGQMTIQRYPRGFCPTPHLGVSPFAAPAMGILPGMANSVLSRLAGAGLGAAAGGAITANPFGALMGAGLGGMIGASPFGSAGALGGAGQGSWNPNARPGAMTNNSRGAETNHIRQGEAILNDPNLSVEDAIMLLMMQIMKKMDKDIKAQAQKVNKMQNGQDKKKQNSGGKSGGKSGGGKGGSILGKAGKAAGSALGGPVGGKVGSKAGNAVGGALGGQGANGAKKGEQGSKDTEMAKLKAMQDKRGQMFQILQKIIEGYNQTAKGTIQSMNR